MRTKPPATAFISDRHGTSEREIAVIASCVLQDVGMINEGYMSLVIDKSKLRREKHSFQKEFFPNVELHGLYFDGRKGNSYDQEKKW